MIQGQITAIMCGTKAHAMDTCLMTSANAMDKCLVTSHATLQALHQYYIHFTLFSLFSFVFWQEAAEALRRKSFSLSHHFNNVLAMSSAVRGLQPGEHAPCTMHHASCTMHYAPCRTRPATRWAQRTCYHANTCICNLKQWHAPWLQYTS